MVKLFACREVNESKILSATQQSSAQLIINGLDVGASGGAKEEKGKQIGTGELRILEPKTPCHLGHGAQAALACCGITCQLDSGEAVTQGQDRDISGGIYMVTPPHSSRTEGSSCYGCESWKELKLN